MSDLRVDKREYGILIFSRDPYWIIKLAPNQCLLGRCVISSKRHVGDLADLTPDEMLDFLTLIGCLERAIRLALGATMFNWSCYMNLSFREEKPDPQFGHPYDHNRWLDLPAAIRVTIAAKIGAHRPKPLQPDRRV